MKRIAILAAMTAFIAVGCKKSNSETDGIIGKWDSKREVIRFNEGPTEEYVFDKWEATTYTFKPTNWPGQPDYNIMYIDGAICAYNLSDDGTSFFMTEDPDNALDGMTMKIQLLEGDQMVMINSDSMAEYEYQLERRK